MARKPKNLDTVVRKEPKKRSPRTKKVVVNDEPKKEVVATTSMSNDVTETPNKSDIPVVEKTEEVTPKDTNVNNMYLGLLIIAALALPVLIYLGIR